MWVNQWLKSTRQGAAQEAGSGHSPMAIVDCTQQQSSQVVFTQQSFGREKM